MTYSEVHADAVSVLKNWAAPNAAQSSLREAYLAFLDARDDATMRSCVPGHLTASAIVLSADRTQTLLTLHPRVGRWLQLGGHCENGDVTLAGAALREATEESGIAELWLELGLVQLAVHPITCSLGVPTRHFDARFTVIAPEGAEPVRSDESDDLAWWPLVGLPCPIDPLLADLIGLARSRTGTH